jgi:DNA-binding transcriptional regulator YiaG
MPNIATVLKEEIARIARREIRDEVASLRKASTLYRSEIAELKRRNKELEQAVRRLQRASGTSAQPSQPEPKAAAFRFSAKRLAALRQRLGLSAAEFGLLIDASDQSVYKWEDDKVHPRGKSLEAIAAISGIGKREAAARLAELTGAV